VPHTQGEITFLGESLQGVEANAIVSRGLIQVPEGRLIFPNLTVLENLELGSYQRAKARRASNLDKILNWFPRLRERLTQL
jgi:branched-chain amino acid transport system ATP-binding protein